MHSPSRDRELPPRSKPTPSRRASESSSPFAIPQSLTPLPPTLGTSRDSSNLLAHEAAFALGQTQDVDAISALNRFLMIFLCIPLSAAVEALGAIGLGTNVPSSEKSLVADPA
ncbi:unnamed protein product [Camellia sinensis]